MTVVPAETLHNIMWPTKYKSKPSIFPKENPSKISTVHINRKLENWYTLSGNEFLKEISKQKIELPLKEQQEWLQYFEEQKIKADHIRQVITQTDAAIDQMVYALYGLSDEEIKIVEVVS